MENRRKIANRRVLNVTNMIERYDNGEFCLDTAIQRAVGQWSKAQKSLLINSILTGYKIPPIWISVTATEFYPENSVIDGIQRMSAIIQFIKDEFILDPKAEPITLRKGDYINLEEDVTYEVAGKKFSQLPKPLQNTILYFDLDLQELYNFTDDEIEEQFFRLNNGTAMTSSQKLKVILGTTLVEKLKPLTELPFWKRSNLKDSAFKKDDPYTIIVQCLMLITGYNFSSFAPGITAKFAAYYSENYNDQEIEYLEQLINTLDENMMTSDENNAFLSKVNIPPLIANADKFLSLKEDGELTDDDYTNFLNDWVSSNAERSGYLKAKSEHTTNGSQVRSRVEILDEWLDAYAADKKNKNTNGDTSAVMAVLNTAEPAPNSREAIEGMFKDMQSAAEKNRKTPKITDKKSTAEVPEQKAG